MRLHANYLDRSQQELVLALIVQSMKLAPLFVPTLPRFGKPFSVRMTNLGELGWVSDIRGYRYQQTHPETGRNWPPIPDFLHTIWRDLLPGAPDPQACLVNYYNSAARMGLHQDKDETDLSVPVLSISLGDTARFKIGGKTRRGPTTSMRLASGDIVILENESRLAFHGVDRIYGGSSNLLQRFPAVFSENGRVNLTLRRVGSPT